LRVNSPIITFYFFCLIFFPLWLSFFNWILFKRPNHRIFLYKKHKYIYVSYIIYFYNINTNLLNSINLLFIYKLL
jgi:hypothetical protein